MYQNPLESSVANQIYDLLVELLGAQENERDRFVEYFTGKEIFPEYRISGRLNPGAKFRYYGKEKMYVDFYQETGSSEKEKLAELVNNRLKSFSGV